MEGKEAEGEGTISSCLLMEIEKWRERKRIWKDPVSFPFV